MNKKTIKAIKDTLAHWDRMIKFASKQPKRKIVACEDMKSAIGEYWQGEYCSLCNLFSYCVDCPLLKKVGFCSFSTNNLWISVNKSKTWGTWTKRAKEFRKQIKSLLKEVK